MPRSGPNGTYTLPGAQATQQPGTPIPSAVNNQGYSDIEQTFNTVQPISYGGTGGATADAARTALAAVGVVRRQVFTASGTYTPHANMLYCIVESIGGGGAGGGVVGAASGGASGGGGGSGGYTRSILTKAAVGASQAVTIGAAGVASAASTGGNGGTTTFGALNTANGGLGGFGGNAATTTAGAGGLGATAASAGTELYAGGSGQGGYTAAPGVTVAMQGTNGGTTVFGGAGYGIVNDGGYPGRAPGAGGGGASSFNSASNRNGGAGAAGIVIVTEFCSQ